MSFVTFSQRTTLSAASSNSGGGTRRISQFPVRRITAAMQEILKRVSWHDQQQNAIRSTRLGLRECRIFYKYMRKIGIKIPVRKSRQHFARLITLLKARASELRGIKKRPVLSKPNPIGPCIPESKSRTQHASLDVPTNIPPDTPRIMESSLRAIDPLLLNSTARSTLSASYRLHAANIPTLQRPLSCTMPQKISIKRSSGDHSSEPAFPIDPCSTPITPLDKIIHTPLYPPSLRRPDIKRMPSDVSVDISEDSAPYFRSTSGYFTLGSALSEVSDRIRRRLSVVSPPEARPMHAPRRLSYSHTYGKVKSPLKRRATAASTDLLDSCAETSDLLASPLVIITSSSNRQLESAARIDNKGRGAGFSFSLRGSPIALKV